MKPRYKGMVDQLPPAERHRINVSQRPSRKTKAIVYKHYPPDGTKQQDGHTMPDNQCCIRTVTNGLTRATSYAIEGETTKQDFSERVQVLDLAATTAKKKKRVNEMYIQYNADAKLLALNSRYEYYLINAINHINSVTLSIIVNKGVSAKTAVMSKVTAGEVYGQTNKDRMKVSIAESDVIFSIHAQGLMMGQGKSKHYDGLRDVMNRNLLSFYAIVLDKTYDDVQEVNQALLEWYGGDWLDSDIEVGILSSLAKYFRDELTIAGIKSIETNVPADPSDIQDESMRKLYETQLGIHQTREKLVDLLQRFSAGHYLHTLASMLEVEDASNIEFENQTDEVQEDITGLAKILDQEEKDIIYSLKRIWRCQQQGGERLALLNELASIYSKNGEEVVTPRLGELVPLLKEGSTEIGALQMIIQQAAQQQASGEFLALLSELGSIYSKNGEEAVTPRLGELVPLLKEGSTEVDALQMIIQQAAQHQRLALLNELAKIYLKEGEEVVTPRLGELVALLKEGSNDILALEMIKQQANQFETTFWMYFKRLEEYIENNDDDDIFFDVDGDKILVVNKWIDKNLWVWWYRQSRFVKDNKYAVIAFEMGEGSSFYGALERIQGFTFDKSKAEQAYDKHSFERHKRVYDKGDGYVGGVRANDLNELFGMF